VIFSDVSASFLSYCALCNVLIQKARYRGVRIILPEDLVMGDDELRTESLSKCFQNIDSSARDEGGDYQGDTNVSSCIGRISGYPYDIGPKTCEALRSELKTHHLHLSWGVLGCCEVSTFQSGQRVLVEISSLESVFQPDSGDTNTIRHLHNIVVGESAVEWWSRLSDPDGEYEGNLVKKCVLDFASRNSKCISNALAQLPTPCLSDALRRMPSDDQWDYLTQVRREPVEEEDEDEDEGED
jgi:hypothetical protein